MGFFSRLFDWRRSQDPEPVVRSPGRTVVKLRDGTTMSVRRMRDMQGDEEIVYDWPTKLSAYELLVECTAYTERGGKFVSPITVYLFTIAPRTTSGSAPTDAYKKISIDEYLVIGSAPEYRDSVVRFTAQAPFDIFSVTWVPHDAPYGPSDVRGKVQAVFGPKTPDMMLSMIEHSITERGSKHVKQLIVEGKALQPALPS